MITSHLKSALKFSFSIFNFVPHSQTHCHCLIINVVDERRNKKSKKFSLFIEFCRCRSAKKMSVIARLIQSSRAPVLAVHSRFYSAAG